MSPSTFALPHARRWWRACGVLALMVALALGTSPSPLAQAAYAIAQPRAAWVTDGEVTAVAQVGNTIYLGGDFHVVGPPTGSFVALDGASGAYDPAFPVVTEGVAAVAPDGSGGWFIGGSFTAVGRHPRNHLAHIAADRTLDPLWNPNIAWDPNFNGVVRALAVQGSTVYVGGGFSSVGGQARSGLAALDATTGQATNWNPNVIWDPNIDGLVSALAVSGNTVYISGGFSSVGGQARSGLAALDATTGLATGWDPNPDGLVSALAVSGSTVYVGGRFTSVGGQVRNSLAALDATTGLPTTWDPNPRYVYGGNHWAPGAAHALTVSGNMVYVGGYFDSVGGQLRNSLAALDATTGLATTWNPNVSRDGCECNPVNVWALAVSGNTVYVSGDFTSIGGQVRNNLAALDATTALVTAWDPHVAGYVAVLAVRGTTVYAGGDFSSVGGQVRNGLAVFDATTGLPTTWDPNIDGVVRALAVHGSTVYVGGGFSSVGGQARNNLAALDTTTGLPTAWDPNIIYGEVNALAVSGSTIYAGGDFRSVGGQARNGLAALDAITGSPTAWNPNVDGDLNINRVWALALSGSTIYAGGDFSSVGGQARNGLAALDATTGLATAWNPHPDNWVRALAVSGNTVYAGGYFTSIGGQVRSGLAALDASTGLATTWDPTAGVGPYGECRVSALALSGSTVYVGGYFGSIGGQVRTSLAALDASTGLATTWDPTADGNGVLALDAHGPTLVVGGAFHSIGIAPQSGVAIFPFVPPVYLPLIVRYSKEQMR